MKQRILITAFVITAVTVFTLSCQKSVNQPCPQDIASIENANANREAPPFNLEVILRGEGKSFGLIKFRQDVDPAKIIVLDTWVRDLEPNHQYLLQRAVDPINVVDGNCSSDSWLTLGHGLTPQSILTNEKGTGSEELWRNISMIPSGSAFDIHFRILDAVTMNVMLTSDCYKYVVR